MWRLNVAVTPVAVGLLGQCCVTGALLVLLAVCELRDTRTDCKRQHVWCRCDAACCVDQIWLSGETCAARRNEGSLGSRCHNIRLQVVHMSSTTSNMHRAEAGTGPRTSPATGLSQWLLGRAGMYREQVHIRQSRGPSLSVQPVQHCPDHWDTSQRSLGQCSLDGAPAQLLDSGTSLRADSRGEQPSHLHHRS